MGPGSGTGAIGTGGAGIVAASSAGITTTGASIRCCQYEAAIARCQKRGISKRKSMICAITKAPITLFRGHELRPNPKSADQQNGSDDGDHNIAGEEPCKAAKCVPESRCDGLAHRPLVVQNRITPARSNQMRRVVMIRKMTAAHVDEGYRALRRCQRPGLSLAGFEVISIGRFCLIVEDSNS
jgi:hypothetical protein